MKSFFLHSKIAKYLPISTALGWFLSSSSAQAYSLNFDPGSVLKTSSQLGSNDPAYIIFSVVNTSLIFLGTVTLIMIIAAGFLWLTAAGEEEKIEKAKEILQGAIIGLIIVLSSYGLAQYLFTALQIAITSPSS